MIRYHKSTSSENVTLDPIKKSRFENFNPVTKAWYALPNSPKFLLGDSYQSNPSLKFSPTEVSWVHKNGKEFQLAGDQAHPQTIVTLGKRIDMPAYRLYASDMRKFPVNYSHGKFTGNLVNYVPDSNTPSKFRTRTRVLGYYTIPQGTQTNEMVACFRWTTSGSFYGSYIPKDNPNPGTKVEWVTLTEGKYYEFARAIDRRPTTGERYTKYLHMGIVWMLRLNAGKLEVIAQDFIADVSGHYGHGNFKNIYGDGYSGYVSWVDSPYNDYINTPSITLQVNILPRTTY